MKFIFWVVVMCGAFYSFGHAYFLIKDKNKLGAIGISVVGLTITILPFFIRIK
jgi:hypothetical protein